MPISHKELKRLQKIQEQNEKWINDEKYHPGKNFKKTYQNYKTKKSVQETERQIKFKD